MLFLLDMPIARVARYVRASPGYNVRVRAQLARTQSEEQPLLRALDLQG